MESSVGGMVWKATRLVRPPDGKRIGQERENGEEESKRKGALHLGP